MEINQERRLKKGELAQLAQHSSSCGVWSIDYQIRSWNEASKILKNIEAKNDELKLNDEEW